MRVYGFSCGDSKYKEESSVSNSIMTLREFFDHNPDVFQQWDASRNDSSCLDLLVNSSRKAWWICDVYHCSYQKPIRDKVSNPDRCSVCTGSTVFSGYNDLFTVFPDVAVQWDYNKNDMKPRDVKFSSGKSVWWICDKGHSWKTRISHRTSSGSGCPVCQREQKAHRQIEDSIRKYGSVCSKYDDMSRFFVSSTRDDVPDPPRNSHIICIWKCDKGHTWSTYPRNFRGCPYCLNKADNQGNRTYVIDSSIADNPLMNALFSDDNPTDSSAIAQLSAKKVIWECDNGHTWEARAYSVKKSVDNGTTGCPYCHHIVSQPEKNLYDFLTAYIDPNQIIRNDRTLISPHEVDLYIPNKNIAIEYNGLYWHTEEHTGYNKNYHYDKWKRCADQGVQLITIWEDTYRDNPDIVHSMLKHKLGVDDSVKVYARKTTLRDIDYITSSHFLDQYHIQGAAYGSYYCGVFHNDNLVAVSVWRKNGNAFYLDRYATSYTVIGEV